MLSKIGLPLLFLPRGGRGWVGRRVGAANAWLRLVVRQVSKGYVWSQSIGEGGGAMFG